MRLAFGVWPLPMLILPIAMLFAYPGALADSAVNPAAVPVEILKYELAANQDTPELCFLLSETVARRPATPLESFAAADPAVPLSAIPRNDRLCLTGFVFGNTYTVSLKAGLPGVAGVLPKDVQYRIQVPNRPPELSFAAPNGDSLPRIGSGGLPIRSVNIPKIDVQLFRIADDDLVFGPVHTPLTAEAAADFAPGRGTRVWQGSVDPKGDQNQDSVTLLPVDQTIGGLKSGLYVATVWPTGMPSAGQTLPTQYFTVSDIGLAAYRGPASLLIAARSLATGAAAPGIDVALIARNNREFGRVRSDGNGFARFDSGLLQGAGGDSPWTIHAYGTAGEFAVLDLDGPAGADTNQPNPRSDTALIHLDRSGYRPGETVNILALLRNDQGAAAPKLPMRMTITRPGGAIFSTQVLSDQGDGSYNFGFALPETGSEGPWRVEALSDPAGEPLGNARFDVVAARPSPLTVALNADVAVIDPAQPANIAIQTQTPEGPAPNAPGELHIEIGAAATAFPAFPGFYFGSVDENIPPLSLDTIRFATDAGGKANLPVKFAAPPKATKPLEATIVARMFDPAGRVIERSVEVPVANQNLMLGVKPTSDAIFPAGQSAHFEIIAVSPDGARQEKAGAGWEILRQDWKPSWYWDGKRFTFRPAIKDSHIAGGTVDIPANAPAMLDSSLPPGRYRIEVFDPNGEAISSARFMVGWAVRGAGDPPDAVALTPAKPFYAPGESADIFVKPPYDADVTLASADPEVRDAIVQHVPSAGAMVHLNLPRDAGSTTRLLATAIAPPDADTPGLTRRAFGQAALAADPAPRSLDVKLDLPDTTMPQRTLSIPVTVTAAGEEAIHVRIAALDDRSDGDGAEREPAPDTPVAKTPTVVASDNYGRVITPSGVSSGSMAGAVTPATGKTPRAPGSQGPAQPPLALYSGIVMLDKNGKGNVLMVLPDFAGKLKITALAWSADRIGRGGAALAVRYPLNATLNVPAFLAPDDHADLTLALDNIDGPRGEYRVRVHAEASVAVQDETEAVVNLAEHEQRTASVSLTAHGAGDGAVTISVKGPNGIAFERRLGLKVGAAAPPVTRHALVTLKPGATLAVDPALTAGIRPDSLSFSLTVSAGNDLDLGGIAHELTASDDGSAEQLIDAATLFLAPPAALATMGLIATEAPAPAARLEHAAEALAAYQGGDGGISLWGSSGESDVWLTAYAVDFLVRAKSHGAPVSDIVLNQALDYLALHAELQGEPTSTDPNAPSAGLSQQTLASAAYAVKALAANGRLNLFQLRYFNDRFGAQLRNPASAGLIAASFAALGDKAAAAAAFARAATLPADPSSASAFGSDLRDQALLTALMAESGSVAQPSIASATTKMGAIAAGRRQFSASEASWIYRAGVAQTPSGPAFALKVGDRKIEQSAAFVLSNAGQSLPAIKNVGDVAVHAAVTITGAPATGEVKDQAGYEVQRWFFDTSGKTVDPASMRQGDLAVVVLTGRFTGQGDAHPVLTDPLPAGWEAEAAEITDPANRYPWLKDLTGAGHAAVRNGRYVATPRLSGEHHEFKLAYVVRAAVRGQFNMPGTVIEDMAQPGLSARAPSGRTKVDPAS